MTHLNNFSRLPTGRGSAEALCCCKSEPRPLGSGCPTETYAITFSKAAWNFFISSARPTVTRMCVGQTGHGRPT